LIQHIKRFADLDAPSMSISDGFDRGAAVASTEAESWLTIRHSSGLDAVAYVGSE
jgi:hypothetical protein